MSEIIFFVDGVLYNSVGLIFVVTGAFIAIRILDFPDLTIDGVFTLGAVLFAKLITYNINPWISVIISTVFGILSASIVLLLNSKLGIGKILSSVLVLIILISLNSIILGQATIGLLSKTTIFSYVDTLDINFSKTYFQDYSYSIHPFSILMIIVIASLILFLLNNYLKSESGTILRCIGGREKSSVLIKRNATKFKFIGLAISSSLVSLGGAIEAQRKGSTDLGMGTGMLLIALCAVVLGESLIRFLTKRDFLTVNEIIYSIILGTLTYSFVVQIILMVGLSTVDIKLFTGILLIILLVLTGKKTFRGSEYF
ncbi:MAG: hypothetical protein PVF17_04675 [Ignavibacteria bacterium]|jgi:putative ABC transport system permease protein